MKKIKLNLLAINPLLLGLLISISSSLTFAGESFIPLQKGLRIASDDLVYNDQVLSSKEADRLAKDQQVNLANLNPLENDIWSDQVTNILDQKSIAINELDVLTYEGALSSNSGLFRFNAIPVDGNKIFTIHLDKSLHSMLLRKNLLRALGYKVPAMKYLKKVTIQFNNKFALENFLKKEIPEATLGASERWATSNLVTQDLLSVTLRDVAISEPNEFDFYNVSMGLPTQVINSRTLRGLALPYALVDLYESINKFSWVSCKVDNKAVIVPHFTSNDFATTIDDAAWMLGRMNRLTRAEIQKIVAESYMPKEVELILVEKIISRRNALNRCFQVKTPEIAFNAKINGENVKEGKLLKKEYSDYASRFAYGDAESPLEQLRFFLYSKLQSNVIDNLVNRLNSELVTFDLSKKRTEYFQNQFNEGLDHFVKTGELLPIKVGSWVEPMFGLNLILSRDIILGNYLGTDNLVQLADTFGAGVDVGVFVGIEGLGYDIAPSLKVSTSLVRTYTHLKPVKSLKESLKEDYRNMFVGLMKKSLKETFFSLSELKQIDAKDGEEQTEAKETQRKKIEELFKEIDKNLNVGESLIITDKLLPSATLKINYNQGLVGAGVGIAGSATVLKRIHLYKKSPKILQIYDDSGFVKNIDLSFQVSSYINLIRLNGAIDKGHYNVNSYMVNLSTDLSENPNLFTNALGVFSVLKNRDFELLNSNNPPVKLDVQFKDKSKGLSVLFWKMKSLTGMTYFDIKAKDGVQGTYFSLEKDFLTGLNPEAFSKQLLNYYLVKSDLDNVQITEEADKNPGETFFGKSQTQKIRFEAVVGSDKKFGQKFLALSDIKQGWAISEKKLRKFMLGVNTKFQENLFEPDAIDFKKMRLFRVGYHMNIYNRGLERLHSIKAEDINPLEVKYKQERFCQHDNPNSRSAQCGDLNWIKSLIKKCQKPMNEELKASCSVSLFQKMMDDLNFKDFQKLIGEDNLYVYGSIDGFREKSEILNDTVFSNTIGKIGNKQWNGPLEVVRDLLGLSAGETSGSWIRQRL
ncbi:MAG: hypothetical protein HOP07_18030 [Bacteriovoracaceae bacterium]|nr:hypothetical protein [Bacteriovoracaceae bacterium]